MLRRSGRRKISEARETMAATVRLNILTGPMRGNVLTFHEPFVCLAGRHASCHIQLPDDPRVSRNHTQIDINPPRVRARDLGSLNGTMINGVKYGGRDREGIAALPFTADPVTELQDQDLIQIGDTVIRIEIHDTQILPDSDSQDSSGATPVTLDGFVIPGYTMTKLLGSGGFGAIYLAIRLADQQSVAIKIMRADINASAYARQKFLHEIEAMKSLRHRNIVELFDHGVSGSHFFFVMEYCAAGSAADLMSRRGGPLDVGLAVRLTRDMLRGLAEAHRHHFVHRDIKPQNMLLNEDGQRLTAKLADFGLAKNFELAGLSGLTRTDAFAGTFYFIPPEQVLDFKYVRPASDIWSTGATLYHMVTGLYPKDFQRGPDPFTVILSGSVIPVEERNPDVPGPIREVLARSLQHDPSHRFATAADMLLALDVAVGACGFER